MACTSRVLILLTAVLVAADVPYDPSVLSEYSSPKLDAPDKDRTVVQELTAGSEDEAVIAPVTDQSADSPMPLFNVTTDPSCLTHQNNSHPDDIRTPEPSARPSDGSGEAVSAGRRDETGDAVNRSDSGSISHFDATTVPPVVQSEFAQMVHPLRTQIPDPVMIENPELKSSPEPSAETEGQFDQKLKIPDAAPNAEPVSDNSSIQKPSFYTHPLSNQQANDSVAVPGNGPALNAETEVTTPSAPSLETGVTHSAELVTEPPVEINVAPESEVVTAIPVTEHLPAVTIDPMTPVTDAVEVPQPYFSPFDPMTENVPDVHPSAQPASTQTPIEATSSSLPVSVNDESQLTEPAVTQQPSGEKEPMSQPVSESATTPAADPNLSDQMESASRQTYETVVPVAYQDTFRLYLSCLDFLPAPVNDLMDSYNVRPHAAILTVLIGSLWILMMSAKLYLDRGSRHKELEDEVRKGASLVSKLRMERKAIMQQTRSENDKISHLESCLKESNRKLVDVEDSCRKEETRYRELVSRVRELEDQVHNGEQANHSVQLEKQRLEKESQELQKQVMRLSDEKQNLEERCEQKEAQLESLTHENESLFRCNSDLTASRNLLQQRTSELEEEMEKVITQKLDQGKQIEELTSEIEVLKNEMAEKDKLYTALKDMMKELDFVTGRSDETDWGEEAESESKVDELIRMAKGRVEQDSLMQQKTQLEQRLSEALLEKEQLFKQMNDNSHFVDASAQQVRDAISAKEEAETRLQVLEKYFNSREVELQRELGALQVRRQQKEEDASSLEIRLAQSEEERDSYRSQLESMRRELSESERSFKAQLANMEKRAHENWIAARNSEREASDLRRDAVYLRQELTMLAAGAAGNATSAPIMDFSSFPLPPPPPPPPAGPFNEQFMFPPMPPFPPHDCMTPDSTAGMLWDGGHGPHHHNQPPPSSPREAL